MTPLPQQLEDKKKGCGCEFIDGKNVYNCGERWYTHHIKGDVYDCLPNYCPKCKYEIAILEQAISEMQKQRQDFIFLLEDLKEETTCIGCSKEYTYAFKTFRDIIDKKIEQLNQPKTEK